MKLSEMHGAAREQGLAYVKERWQQLSDSGLQREAEALKYLMLVNGAPALPVLGLVGGRAAAGTPLIRGAFVMLICFVLGVVLVGVLIAIRGYRIMWLFSKWRADVNSLYQDRLEWEQLVEQDSSRSTYLLAAHVMGWGAFLCFVVGALIGLVSWLTQP